MFASLFLWNHLWQIVPPVNCDAGWIQSTCCHALPVPSVLVHAHYPVNYHMMIPVNQSTSQSCANCLFVFVRVFAPRPEWVSVPSLLAWVRQHVRQLPLRMSTRNDDVIRPKHLQRLWLHLYRACFNRLCNSGNISSQSCYRLSLQYPWFLHR